MLGVRFFCMVGTKQKYEIAYLLASLLRAGEVYDSARLDEFIARTVRPDILGRRGYSPDHLRRCMIDNGFLSREPDGSKYWISGAVTGPEEERKLEEEKQNLLLRGAQEEKAVCPYCGVKYSGGRAAAPLREEACLRKGVLGSADRGVLPRDTNLTTACTRPPTRWISCSAKDLGRAGDAGRYAASVL
jgi:hypothetical protein